MRLHLKWMPRWAAACAGVAVLLIAAVVFHRHDPRPNVLLISIDTLRADHLGAYGYGRDNSPVMDAIAERGILFKHAISQAPWTLPAMASVLTSLYPSEHGAIGAATRLSDDVETLAEVLNRSGYYTVGVVSHSFLDRLHGLAQGFDAFDESQIANHDAVTSAALTRIAAEYMKEGTRRRPFFLWVHYFDPHFTYVRHSEYGFGNDYAGELPARVTTGELDRVLHDANLKGKGVSESDLEYVEAVYDEEIAHRLLDWTASLANRGRGIV